MYLREQYLKQMIQFRDTDFIKVVTGVRRAGKSVLLQQYASYLRESGIEESHILHINLESFEYQSIKESDELSEIIMGKMPQDGKIVYLILDEIQFVSGWQKLVNALRVSFDCDIVITGSNSNLLSGELATLLSGRYVEIKVYPFSFAEFLAAKGIDRNSREVDIAYREYERYGAFPSVALSSENIKTAILSGIYDSILLNDIAARGLIRDTFSLKRLVSFLADNVGQLVNPTKISNILKKEKINLSNHTIQKYLELLEDAFLFFEAKPYDIRGKAYLKHNSKYFMVDNGLRNHSVGFKESNHGNRLENIVYMELLRRGYHVDIVRIGEKEVDFLARKEMSQKYYQVCYQLPENTHETDNLLLIKDNFEKTLITGRYEGTDSVDGIKVKYIVDWLLED